MVCSIYDFVMYRSMILTVFSARVHAQFLIILKNGGSLLGRVFAGMPVALEPTILVNIMYIKFRIPEL